MPPVTLALIAANVAVYLLQTAQPGLAIPFALWPLSAGAASGGQVSFEVWQLLTYGFLHGGFVHLLFNMFALYMFGGALEQVVGPRRFTAFYLVSVLAAAITQLIVMALAREIYPRSAASAAYSACFSPTDLFSPTTACTSCSCRSRSRPRHSCSSTAASSSPRRDGHPAGCGPFPHLGGSSAAELMLAYWRANGSATLRGTGLNGVRPCYREHRLPHPLGGEASQVVPRHAGIPASERVEHGIPTASASR